MPEAQDSGIPQPSETPSSTTSSSAPSMEARYWKLLLGIALLAALALYLPSVWFGVVYDDRLLLMTNPLIRAWSNIPFFFKHHMFMNVDPSGGIYYRPVVMAVLIATTKLLGINIWAYHLVSVLLYLLMIPSVFFLAHELGFPRAISGWSALLFAVHPMHIEVVAWATGQADTIAALPFVLALALYRRAQRLQRWSVFMTSAGMYALALLAKESAIIFPALAIAMEIIWRAEKRKTALLRLATLFVMTAGYLMVRVAVLGEIAYRQVELSWKTILLTIPSLLSFYFWKLTVPLTTSLFYDTYYIDSWTSLNFLVPSILLLLALALLLVGWKRRWLTQAELFCCVAMFLCLAPLMDLRVFRWRQFAHDRFLYLTSIFFLALLASLLVRLTRYHALILSGIAVFFALQTEAQVWNFQSEFKAFDHACEVAPNSLGPLVRMATLLTEQGRHPEAKLFLHRVTLLSPDWPAPYYDLAKLEFEDGNFPEAEKQLRKSMALNPRDLSLHAFLAQILEREGRTSEAQQEQLLAQPPTK